jgi:hypothetical protein
MAGTLVSWRPTSSCPNNVGSGSLFVSLGRKGKPRRDKKKHTKTALSTDSQTDGDRDGYVITSRNAAPLVCTLGEAYDLVLLLLLLLLLLGQSKITRSILRKTATTTSHRRRRERKQTRDD